jgi:hypothetical protein
MGKEIYVQSIGITRPKEIPLTLFHVTLRGFTEEPITAFMYADDIVRTLSYDANLKLILADAETNEAVYAQLGYGSSGGSQKQNFYVLKKSGNILIEK